MSHQQYYTQQSTTLSQQIKTLRGRARAFVAGEIATFLGAVGCLALLTLGPSVTLRGVEIAAAVVLMAIYIMVRQRDAANDERIRELEDLRQVYDNELRALTGDFSCYDDGQRYADPHHAYSYDLDIFGASSLYQRMCRTATTGGSDALARRLQSVDGRSEEPLPGSPFDKDVEAYRQEIDRLAEDEAFRARFIAHGVRQKIDTDAMRRALDKVGSVKVARAFGHNAVVSLVGLSIAGFWASVSMASMGMVSGLLPLWWAMAQFFGVLFFTMRILKEVSAAMGSLHGQMRQMAGLARMIDPEGAKVFSSITRLLDGLDRRANILGLLLVDGLGLYDFFLVRRFLKWTDTDLPSLYHWIDRVVETDLRVSIATLRYNHPRTTWPEAITERGVRFEAEGLYHPFLGEEAVTNDFTIADRHFYIVTGANMAGKSTFLRSVGVGYVMAMAGMPVFAERLRVSSFKLFSSMRTSDDLSQGISYFNAELLRLRQLIDTLQPADSKQPTLIILDEILKGTNSLDKLNGSRLFLEHVSDLDVTGLVATHDLELSKMEGERYHNYCFEIDLGDDVTYSYKVSPGVARNQNATFLLRRMLSKQ